MKEKVLQEITEKRDRYTKHFMLPEKGTAAAVYPEPVHYETESGWEEIDNRLEAVSKDGKECYQNKASDLQVCFAKQTGENTLVSMEKDGKKVSWTMEENVVLARSARQARTGKSSFQILTEEEFPKNSTRRHGERIFRRMSRQRVQVTRRGMKLPSFHRLQKTLRQTEAVKICRKSKRSSRRWG